MCAALTMAVDILEQPQSTGFDSEFDFNRGVSFYEEVRRFESDLIKRALRQTEGRQTQAAALLGINHTTLHAMMKRYNIKARSL
jgi:DNA-binding NtrC family response regulator